MRIKTISGELTATEKRTASHIIENKLFDEYLTFGRTSLSIEEPEFENGKYLTIVFTKKGGALVEITDYEPEPEKTYFTNVTDIKKSLDDGKIVYFLNKQNKIIKNDETYFFDTPNPYNRGKLKLRMNGELAINKANKYYTYK